MVKLPKVSIVVPVYNEENVIRRCIQSCIDQTEKPYEIIIVNNNSTDRSASIARYMQHKYSDISRIRVITEKRQGIVFARNHGFDSAKGDVLGRIDADSTISEDWVYSVRRLFLDKTIAASTGPVGYNDMPLRKIGLALDTRVRRVLYSMAKDHTFLFGSNMAMRKSAWKKIKPYTHLDEEGELHEDIDLALCLFKNDLTTAYDSTMVGSMSARRIEDKPRDFYSYVMRFERTFKIHNITSKTARIPIFIYMLIYFPVRTIRKFYDSENDKFTFKKFKEDLEAIRKDDS